MEYIEQQSPYLINWSAQLPSLKDAAKGLLLLLLLLLLFHAGFDQCVMRIDVDLYSGYCCD